MDGFTELLSGYRRFRDQDWQRQRERWAKLREGQSPQVMVIACSDSRVDPAQIFDVSPGEIFVVRNVAALVPPFEEGGGQHGVSAALEFAVTQLEVPHIVVMGHGSCGGCAAALSRAFHDAPTGEGGFIAKWVGMLDKARDRIVAKHGEGQQASLEMEHEAVRISLKNLHSFGFVDERVRSGKLSLHGAHFAIRDGILRVMGEGGEFAPA